MTSVCTTNAPLPRIIGVVGAGQMGRGIAQVFAQAPVIEQVILHDTSEQALSAARAAIADSLRRLAEKNKLDGRPAEEILTRIRFEPTLQALAPSEWVIEAIVEDEAAKCALLSQLDGFLSPKAILASNTSSLPISLLAKATRRPEQVIGLHFMNPPPLMPLIEVIPGQRTRDDVRDAALTLARALGKTPVLAQDAPGFIANRILMPLLNEAMRALEEGVASAEDIDATFRLGMRHPMGPLTLADYIGLDTCLAIMNVLHAGLKEERFRPCALLAAHVAAGRLGKKSGKGFYDYAQS